MPHFFDFIHLRDRRDLPHIALVSLLIFGIILGVYLAMQPQLFNKQASEGSLVGLAFAPDMLEVQAGRVYEVKIAIDPKSERVTAAQLAIKYDPAVVTIIEVKNEGFLPVILKSQDTFDGTLNLVYGSTIESQAINPGMLASIRFKVNGTGPSEMAIKGNSQINVSSREENALSVFPVLSLVPAAGGTATGEEDVRYPDSLLLEKAFHPDSEPFVREYREGLEPKPEVGVERIEPEFSGAYIRQLGKDIFVEPVVALNQVLQEKATEIIRPE